MIEARKPRPYPSAAIRFTALRRSPAPEAPPRPVHDARVLTAGTGQAEIRLDGMCYVLRITRQGKLILTK